jgi:hypothetical protein
MALNVESWISGQSQAAIALRYPDIAALFYPNNKDQAQAFAATLQAAADSDELVTRLPPSGRGAFISDLATWAGCPALPSDSPLRYWLSGGEGLEQAQPPGVSPLPMKKKALVEKLEREWRTINADLNQASNNGLTEAASAGRNKGWFEDKAVEWAISKGKMRATKRSEPASPFAGLG